MEWIEVTGRTVDEAKELALDRLGVVETELEYEVIEAPRGGFLGIGRAEARIRARVKPVSREKPGDRRQRRKRGSSERAPRRESGPRRPASRNGEEREEAPGAPPRRQRSSRRGRGGRSGQGTTPSGDPRTQAEKTEADDVVESNLSVEEQASAAARFTEQLVTSFGLTGAVSTQIVDDDIELRVDGENLGVLVGPRGVTLQALEELTRAVVQHAAGGHSARLHLDVAGYRERRREALAEFALKVANEVITSGEEKALEPMNAPDRKVVHDAVSDLEGVATTSEGEDPRRRVIIRPA